MNTITVINTVNTISQFNRKRRNTDKIDAPDRSLPWLGTGTSIKSVGVNLTLWCPNLLSYKKCAVMQMFEIRYN